MPRDSRAYLKDILDCCAAIIGMLEGIDLEVYRQNRVLRRAVEREFTIIEMLSIVVDGNSERFPGQATTS